jgi:hypothetical protein
MREVYLLEAKASVTRVIENVTSTTVIIEPAILDNTPRPPSVLTPNKRGQRGSQCPLLLGSASIKANAKTMLDPKITEGTNQKPAYKLPQNLLSLFIIGPPFNHDSYARRTTACAGQTQTSNTPIQPQRKPQNRELCDIAQGAGALETMVETAAGFPH